MSAAVFDTISSTIVSNKMVFRASGSKLKFDGFLKLYKDEEENKDTEIPILEIDEKVKLNKIEPKQHFTQPPSRYTEASLIKTLEELGDW